MFITLVVLPPPMIFVGIGSRDHEHSATVRVPESDRQDKSTGLPESIYRSER